jgi:hypothetical protein
MSRAAGGLIPAVVAAPDHTVDERAADDDPTFNDVDDRGGAATEASARLRGATERAAARRRRGRQVGGRLGRWPVASLSPYLPLSWGAHCLLRAWRPLWRRAQSSLLALG